MLLADRELTTGILGAIALDSPTTQIRSSAAGPADMPNLWTRVIDSLQGHAASRAA